MNNFAMFIGYAFIGYICLLTILLAVTEAGEWMRRKMADINFTRKQIKERYGKITWNTYCRYMRGQD